MLSQGTSLACIVVMFVLTSPESSAQPISPAKAKSYVLPEGVTAFRPGPGKDIAENNCLVCHSSDYISTQPPRLGKKFWEGEVSKMRKAFGAQISDEDVALIVDYLAQAY